MLNRGCLQRCINACVTEKRERTRGAGIDFTGQVSFTPGQRQRERRCTLSVEGGATSAKKRSCGDGDHGVREVRSVKVRG